MVNQSPRPINQKIRRWLERGDAVPALLGDSGYFLRDGWGHHDLVLVVSQMFNWASPDHIDEAARAVDQAVRRRDDDGNLRAAVDLIWTYVLVGEERHRSLPVDRSLLERALDRAGTARLDDLSPEFVFEVRKRLGALNTDEASSAPQ